MPDEIQTCVTRYSLLFFIINWNRTQNNIDEVPASRGRLIGEEGGLHRTDQHLLADSLFVLLLAPPRVLGCYGCFVGVI